MAYNVDGKIYTDHSLLDEIIYNSRIIVDNIILKNSKVADNMETEYSITQADYYIAIMNGNINFDGFPFTSEMLINYGYSSLQTRVYIDDRNKIPKSDREVLLKFCSKWFIDHYVETNDYYRMLNGEPAYDTEDDFFVYLDPNNPKLMNQDYQIDFDFSAPIHKFTEIQINQLESLGILEDILEECPESEYRYLHYLGYRKIDYYTARVADIWDILYIPPVEPLVVNRFKELYSINKEIYYKRTYQDAYKLDSDYYDEMMMLCIVCQTFADMVVDTPEWYIRRDIFDLRTCQYFLESQGVKFFKQIPLKYQVRMVKNINKLIKYKSTNKNISDILEIFAVDGTTVYKYYLFRKFKYCIYEYTEEGIFLPDGTLADINEDFDFGDEELSDSITDMTGATIYDFIDDDKTTLRPSDKLYYYDFGDENDADIDSDADYDYKEEQKEAYKIVPDEEGNVYELEFVKTPIGENYDDYIKDSMNRQNYDMLTLNDPYWDGEDVHSFIKNKHLMRDFTIEGSKYMSLEYKVSMEEFMIQMAYFLTLLFQSNVDTSSIRFTIPSINQNMEFSLRNIFVLVYCLNGLYNDKKPNIRLPGNLRTKPKPEYSDYPNDVDGGYPWSGINPETGEEILPPNPMPEVEEGWEVPDLDCGTDDTELLKEDKYAKYYDFGYHIDISKYSRPFYDYDYGNEDDGVEEVKPPKDPDDVEYWDDYERGYYDRSINGHYPDVDQRYLQDYDGGRGEYSVITHETFYDWIRWKYPYMWVDISGRILGFNVNVNLEEIEKNISIRHSKFQFEHGFTLKDLGCDTFKTAKSINSIEEFIDIYKNNLNCYRTLKQLLIDTTDRDEKRVYQYVYDTLFTSEYPYDTYRLPDGEYAKTYIDILKVNDSALYKFYKSVEKETDKEVRKEIVRGILNEIVSVLEYYIDGTDLNYVLSFIGTNTLEAIIQYISLVINFFKSWKAYFLDPVVTYELNDKTENMLNHNDTLVEIKRKLWYNDNDRHRDMFSTTYNYEHKELRTERQKEILETISHYEPEKPFKVYDGGRITDEYDVNINSDYPSVAIDLPIIDGAYDVNGGRPYSDEPIYGVILPPNPATVPEPVPYSPEWKVPNLDFGDEDTTDITIDRFTVYYDFGNEIDIRVNEDIYDYDYNIEYDDEDSDDGEFFEPVEPNLDFSKHSTTQPLPYFQVNGGLIAARQDVYNLDGAGALKMQEYLTVDGKRCTDIDKNTFIPDLKTGLLCESSYDINGGVPSIYHYFSKSMITNINDNLDIEIDVKISPYHFNGIEILNDGLYVSNVFVSDDSYELIESDVIEFREELMDLIEQYGEIVKVYGNYDTMSSTVDDIFNDYFKNPQEYLVDMKDSNTKNDIYNYASERSRQIRDWFINANLFAWEELKE